MLSHRSAAACHEIADDEPRLRIEITVPHADGGGRRLAGLVIHRSRLPMADDLTVRNGIPLTSVERTLIDLACTTSTGLTRRAFERADRLGLLDVGALLHLRERARARRGIGRIDPLLRRHRPIPFTRSELERRFLHLCDVNGIARPAVNVLLEGHEVDCLWAAARLVVELDGFGFHRDRASFEADRIRDAQLQLAGHRVLRITWRRLVESPAEVANEVRGLLALGGRVKSHTG